MNKTELISSLSEETGINKKEIVRVLDAFIRILERTLKKGEKLQWSGFGTFVISTRPAREGINPATKQKINLPECKVPKFRPGKNLKEVVKLA